MQEQKRGTFERGTPPETDQMFVDELFFARRKPSDIERQRRQAAIEVPKLRTRKNAQNDRRERFNRMLHFTHQRALQADHVSRERVIQNLTTTVIEDLVPKSPSFKDGVQMLTTSTFAEKACARLDAELIDFERLDKLQFFSRKFA